MIKEDNCTRERQTVNKWDIKKKKKRFTKIQIYEGNWICQCKIWGWPKFIL